MVHNCDVLGLGLGVVYGGCGLLDVAGLLDVDGLWLLDVSRLLDVDRLWLLDIGNSWLAVVGIAYGLNILLLDVNSIRLVGIVSCHGLCEV